MGPEQSLLDAIDELTAQLDEAKARLAEVERELHDAEVKAINDDADLAEERALADDLDEELSAAHAGVFVKWEFSARKAHRERRERDG